MKTAIVILNWNTEGFLKDFLPGLLRSAGKVEGAEVIVADNASTDGSLTLLKEKFPQVRTIVFDRNHGFTGGYNRAFREIESDLFILINSDIEVTEDWLEPLVRWMKEHPECGACAPKLHSYLERNKFEYAGAAGGYIDRFGYPLCRGRVLKRLETDKGQYDSPSDVFWATGACLAVRSEVYRRLGGLDDRFFAHMEEIDLCWRMQLEGWKVTVVPESTVYHVGGGTLPATSPFKLYLNYRNNRLMSAANLGRTYALEYHRKGFSVSDAAIKGHRKAGLTLTIRAFLDAASAAVYLATFRWKCFKSVWKAYKDAADMLTRPSVPEIEKYLHDCPQTAKVRGIYPKWIIWQSLMKGDRICECIDNDMMQQ